MIYAEDIRPETSIHLRAKIAWQQTNFRKEVINSSANYDLLTEMHATGRARDLAEVGKGRGPALVLSSGSSLNAVLPDLAQWKGAIICSTTQASSCTHFGRDPTHICCVDPNVPPKIDEMGVPRGSWRETVFLSHPGGPPAFFRRWFDITPAEAWLFRVLEPTYEFYTHYQPWAYPWIQQAFYPFIDSVAMEVAIAGTLGYDPLFLAGADYGGPRYDGREYVDGAWKVVDGSNTISGEKPGPGGLVANDVMLYSMRGVLITAIMQMMHPKRKTRIYQLAEHTNLNFFPHAPWAEVLEKQGRIQGPEGGSVAWAETSRKAEVYLASSYTFLVPIANGFAGDQRVFMILPQNAIQALTELNVELMSNKVHFAQLEQQFKRPVAELLRSGQVAVDKGDMLVHTPQDLNDWDWHRIRTVDLEAQYIRMGGLFREGMEKYGSTELGGRLDPASSVITEVPAPAGRAGR